MPGTPGSTSGGIFGNNPAFGLQQSSPAFNAGGGMFGQSSPSSLFGQGNATSFGTQQSQPAGSFSFFGPQQQQQQPQQHFQQQQQQQQLQQFGPVIMPSKASKLTEEGPGLLSCLHVWAFLWVAGVLWITLWCQPGRMLLASSTQSCCLGCSMPVSLSNKCQPAK